MSQPTNIVKLKGIFGVPEYYERYSYRKTYQIKTLLTIDANGVPSTPYIKRAKGFVPLKEVDSVASYLRSKRAIYSLIEPNAFSPLVQIRAKKTQGEVDVVASLVKPIKVGEKYFLDPLGVDFPEPMRKGCLNLGHLLLTNPGDRAKYLERRIEIADRGW